MRPVTRAIVTATALSGSLDLLSAFAFSAVKGVGPLRVLQGVAAGPFGDPMLRGTSAPVALAGLIVHYALMTVMVTLFVAAASLLPFVRRRPLLWGTVYGLGLYLLMYWIVLPLRWPGLFPRTGAWDVGNALFSHLLCVGLPMGWVIGRIEGDQLGGEPDR
ncbi:MULTISPECIES: hypothetical protein [unclassified Sphingomonas]|uniref:hypothetical protein n=1 Tax=unclassified Sphingomonas TaxID=196159 RepID=UPI0006FBDA6C|nr:MULTISPECIES: hypothetical protein [unclassified Sphingomonas]KQX25403.1 hypothetical protein ASD17_21620 [Sphingomonas sp. Root1294]KQY66395.1 hypothetical protein ASD39_11425 [Sphingomonas sp. Root50]KRB90289.1 hypothetical protein ASE22_15525 [Sphingomonas sp. Root720]